MVVIRLQKYVFFPSGQSASAFFRLFSPFSAVRGGKWRNRGGATLTYLTSCNISPQGPKRRSLALARQSQGPARQSQGPARTIPGTGAPIPGAKTLASGTGSPDPAGKTARERPWRASPSSCSTNIRLSAEKSKSRFSILTFRAAREGGYRVNKQVQY